MNDPLTGAHLRVLQEEVSMGARNPTLKDVSSAGDIPERRTLEVSDAARRALDSSDIDEKDDTIRQLVALWSEERAATSGAPPSADVDSAALTTTQGVAQFFALSPEKLVKRAVGTLVVALALVQPLVSNLAQNYLGESDVSVLERKLDAVIEAQAKSEKQLMQAASFLVDSEKARRAGAPLPPIPAMLTLMAAIDEVEKTTGQ